MSTHRVTLGRALVVAALASCCGVAKGQLGSPAAFRLTPQTIGGFKQAGYSLAAEAEWAFVGVPGDDSFGFWSGAVVPFELVRGLGWVERPTITSFSPYSDQYFGLEVEVGGGTLAVGCPQDSRVALGAGAVEVFDRVGGSWVFSQVLVPAFVPAQGDQFGASVSMRGERMAVGAPSATTGGQIFAGRASIFERVGGFWSPVVDLEKGVEDELYGWQTAVGDGFVAVGTFNVDGDRFTYQGRGIVDVYEPVGGSWVLTATLEQDVPKFNERFAWSMDAAEGTIVVGAYNEGAKTSFFFDGPGAVYVFEKIGGVWSKAAKLEAPDKEKGDQFGYSVAITSDAQHIVIGAYEDDDAGEQAGSLYTFKRSGAGWQFVKKTLPLPVGPAANLGKFGFSAAAATDTSGGVWSLGGAPGASVQGLGSGDVYASLLDADCYADCDGSGVLSIFDYICFSNLYASASPLADCDGSGGLSIFDYICFSNAYSAGCP